MIESKSIFDVNEALTIIQDDEEFLKELAAIFLDDYHSQIAKIEKAVITSDSRGLAESVHKLKGSVANFGKNRVFEIVSKLENIGKRGKMGNVEHTFHLLVKELESLVKVLREYINP